MALESRDVQNESHATSPEYDSLFWYTSLPVYISFQWIALRLVIGRHFFRVK